MIMSRLDLPTKNERDQIEEISSQLFYLMVAMADVLMLHSSILCSSNIGLVYIKATKLIGETVFGGGNKKDTIG